jgi:hypothetical protein
MGVIIPGCMLIYGWSIEKGKGGIPLPVIVMFIQGVAQLFCFPSLNTYCLDVMQKRSSEVVAGNYMLRYLFTCCRGYWCGMVQHNQCGILVHFGSVDLDGHDLGARLARGYPSKERREKGTKAREDE